MLKELFLKELVILAVVTAIGAAPVTLLRLSDGLRARIALAPAFGVAISAALLTSVNFVVPLHGALWWFLVPLGLVSLAVAGLVARRRDPVERRLPRLPELAVLAFVSLLVLGTMNLPLHHRLSPGPLAYGIYDSPGYATEVAGFAKYTNDVPLTGGPDSPSTGQDLDRDWGPDWNQWTRYAFSMKYQHTGGETIPAAIASSLGWRSYEAVAPFMAVLVLIAAFGTLALAYVWTGSLLAALLAGIGGAGPVLFQIYMDGAAGLLAGTAVLATLMVVGTLAILRPSWRLTIASGLLMAGVQTLYPEMIALPVLALFGSLVLRGLLAWRDGSLHRGAAVTAVRHVVAFGALAVLLAPRASLWTGDYYLTTLRTFADTIAINYNMQAQHVLGWLTQTREFYSFAWTQPLADVGFGFVGVLLPAGLVVLGLLGARRNRLILPAAVFFAVAVAQSLATVSHYECHYCVQRTMLTTIPVVTAFLAAGLVWGLQQRAASIKLVAAIATLCALAAGTSAMAKLQQRADYGWMPDYELPFVSDKAAELTTGTIAMEGHDALSSWAWAEQPLTYQELQERTGRRISYPAAYDEWGGTWYFGGRQIDDPTYTPDYDYVVSRFGALQTPRQVLYRKGPYVIERRSDPFDAIPVRGMLTDTSLRDKQGHVFLQAEGAQAILHQGPPTFWISARSSAKAYMRMRLRTTLEVTPRDVKGASVTSVPDGRELCAPVPGTGPKRIVAIPITPNPGLLTGAADPLDNSPTINHDMELVAIEASTRPCGTATSRTKTS